MLCQARCGREEMELTLGLALLAPALPVFSAQCRVRNVAQSSARSTQGGTYFIAKTARMMACAMT